MFSFLWLFLFSAFASADELELKVWHAYRDTERQALEKILNTYDAAHPNIRLSVLYVTSKSFRSKLEAAAPQNNGPDLFIDAHDRIGVWAKSKLIAPIELPAEVKLHPVTTQALSYNDQHYGVPLSFKCLALFVNTKLLSQPPKDTDTLLKKASSLQQKGLHPLVYEATTPYHHALWMHGFGGGFFDQEGQVNLDQPGNIKALEFFQELQKAKIIPEEPTSALVSNLFNQEKAAMVINGPWFLGSINKDIEYRIFPLPTISQNGKPARPFLTVEAAMVSAYSQNQSAAADLARYLSTPEVAKIRAIEGRQSVASLDTYDDPAVANDPVLQAFFRQLNNSVPIPNRPETSAIWEPMARAIRRVARGALSPEKALQAAKTEYQIISRPPPEQADPRPYIVLGSLLLLGIIGWLSKQAIQHRNEIRANAFAYLYIAPAALVMLALSVVPFVVGAAVSLFSHHDNEFTFVGLHHFFSILLAQDWPVTSSLSFYFTLVVTIVWTLLNVILHVGIGIALAMLLREPWLRMRAVYRVLLILPWAVPNYITALIWKGMFHRQFGTINTILEFFGVERISWFSQFSTAFCANLVTNTWLGFPFMMVVTLGALQSIPRDLEAAASVDGATGLQKFWHITFPLLKPALLPAVVLGSVWTFNMFNIIYLVSGGEPDSATDILISDAYRWAFTRGHRYGYAAAYAVLIFFILLAYSRIGNKIAGRKTL